MILDSLTASDRAQLHEVYARSVVLLELGRCQEWVELFEPHAVVRREPQRADVEPPFRGREALLHLAERIAGREFDLALGELAATARLRHVLSNICLVEEGTGYVSGLAQVAVVAVGAGAPHWVASGSYADRLHKCGSGCWRFLSRTFTADGAAAVGWGTTSHAGLARTTTSS